MHDGSILEHLASTMWSGLQSTASNGTLEPPMDSTERIRVEQLVYGAAGAPSAMVERAIHSPGRMCTAAAVHGRKGGVSRLIRYAIMVHTVHGM